MPANKDFKRVVRARMQKTGEAYTTARAHLLKHPVQHHSDAAASASAPSAVPASTAQTAQPPDYARLAGLSDAAVKARTGCTWDRWVWALDRVEAYNWPHPQIARYIKEKYKTPSWWTQTVTVGYERIKGLRTIGQLRDGGFNATRSRTFPVPLARLYRAFSDKRLRAKWLPVDLTVRSATANKYVRITWPDRTSVEAVFTPKGRGKSQVQIQQGRYSDKETAARMKQFWSERFETLAAAVLLRAK